MKAKALEYSIADLVAGRRKDKKAFLSQIDLIVDWKPLCAIIEKAYTKGRKHNGRPCHSPLVLFKVELLRTWYGLSDAEVESQVNDRLSFSRFVGIALDDVCPDSTSLCRFRKAMVAAAVYDDLLNELNRQLEQRGVLVKRGAIVDASITDSPRRPRGRKEYTVVEDRKEDDGLEAAESAFVQEAEKPNVDREARWVKKAGKLRFGFKRHTTTNLDGMILAEETTAANESDIKHLTTSIDKAGLPAGTPVMADKGYCSRENIEALKQRKLKDRIMRKASRGSKLTAHERQFNNAISRSRYTVERTFGSIRRWFGAGFARYVGLAKTHGQHIMEAIAYNLYRTPGLIVSKCLG